MRCKGGALKESRKSSAGDARKNSRFSSKKGLQQRAEEGTGWRGQHLDRQITLFSLLWGISQVRLRAMIK
ncbi:MAG: hypothetical protein BYD32DRAFT_417431 [Podila humilis]|nr:MAG: hypothetical protein BYD32DRAFT_417431 [Podila humilis]